MGTILETVTETVTVESPGAVRFSEPSGPVPGADAERDARLLVAGEYPRKGLTVTEADIDALVANFADPVPVKLEHVDTPLDPLGTVRTVWKERFGDGAALMGRLAFPPEVAALLARRGAERLSVGLLKGPAWRLLEASLTLRPHVAGATLLSDTVLSGTPLHDGERAELGRLRAERLEARVGALKASGRLLPSAEGPARALLSLESLDDGAVTLSDGGVESVSAAFLRFLEALPPRVRFGELAGAVTLSAAASGAAASVSGGFGADDFTEEDFTAEEREVLRRLGVDPADVAGRMGAERAAKRGTTERGR